MTDDPRGPTPAAAFADQPGPPEFSEIEAQLLGIVLMKRDAFDEVADLVSSEHFVEEAYGRIWSVLQQLHRRGQPVSLASAVEPIIEELQWERQDVVALVKRLVLVPAVFNTFQSVFLANLIKDIWRRRELFFLGKELQHWTQGGLDNAAPKIIEQLESKLHRLDQGGTAAEERSYSFSESISVGLDQAHAAAAQHASGQLVGVPTGLGLIDRKLGGWRSTDLIMIGSRPGMGKTALSGKFVRAAAERFTQLDPDRPELVAVFSLEMGAEQLALRHIAIQARVSYERIRLGHCDATDLMALDRAGQEIRDLPIRMDDTARSSVSAMRSRVRRWSRKYGRVGLIVVDYLQLVGLSPDEQKEYGGNRVQEISAMTRNLKGLAKDLEVPVICLAQLNREVEKREDKRPMLSDLRESGTIEQDSDIVAFLYREHYYLSQRPPTKKDRESDLDFGLRRVEWQTACDRCEKSAEFIIAKHRHGSAGTLQLTFEPQLMSFPDDSPGGAGGEGQAARARQLALDIQDRID